MIDPHGDINGRVPREAAEEIRVSSLGGVEGSLNFPTIVRGVCRTHFTQVALYQKLTGGDWSIYFE